MTPGEIVQFPVALLIEDFSIIPRKPSDILVAEYAEALAAGATFPPITVWKGTNRIIRGLHRARAAKRIKRETIAALLASPESELAAYIMAVEDNIDHGQRYTEYDLKRISLRLREGGMSVPHIADLIRVRPARVEELVRGVAFTHTGEPRAVKAGLGHLVGTVISDEQDLAISKYGGPQTGFYVRQILLALNNDLIDPSDRSFRLQMDTLVHRWERWKANRGFAAVKTARRTS